MFNARRNARCGQIGKWVGLRTRHLPAWGKNPALGRKLASSNAIAEGLENFGRGPLENLVCMARERISEVSGEFCVLLAVGRLI